MVDGFPQRGWAHPVRRLCDPHPRPRRRSRWAPDRRHELLDGPMSPFSAGASAARNRPGRAPEPRRLSPDGAGGNRERLAAAPCRRERVRRREPADARLAEGVPGPRHPLRVRRRRAGRRHPALAGARDRRAGAGSAALRAPERHGASGTGPLGGRQGRCQGLPHAHLPDPTAARRARPGGSAGRTPPGPDGPARRGPRPGGSGAGGGLREGLPRRAILVRRPDRPGQAGPRALGGGVSDGPGLGNHPPRSRPRDRPLRRQRRVRARLPRARPRAGPADSAGRHPGGGHAGSSLHHARPARNSRQRRGPRTPGREPTQRACGLSRVGSRRPERRASSRPSGAASVADPTPPNTSREPTAAWCGRHRAACASDLVRLTPDRRHRGPNRRVRKDARRAGRAARRAALGPPARARP